MRARACRSVVVAALSLGAGAAWAAPAPGQSPAAMESGSSSSAESRPHRFSVAVGAASVRHLDDSYRVLGDDQRGAASLEVSYELRAPGQGRGLSLGLGIMSDELGPPDGYNQQQAKLRAVSYYALATVGFRRERAIQPFLSVAAGLTRADFTVERSLDTMRAGDHGAFGRASAGLRLAPRWLTYRNERKEPLFALHVSLEGGLLLGSRLTFELTPDQVSDAGTGISPIRVDGVRAGDVMPTALFSGLGVGISF